MTQDNIQTYETYCKFMDEMKNEPWLYHTKLTVDSKLKELLIELLKEDL